MRTMIWISVALVAGMLMAGCDDAKENVYVDTNAVDTMARGLLNNIAEGTPEVPYERYFSTIYKRTLSLEDWKTQADEYKDRLGKVVKMSLQQKEVRAIQDIPDGVFLYDVTWEKTSGMLQLNATQQTGEWEITYMSISCPEFEEALDSIKKPVTTP